MAFKMRCPKCHGFDYSIERDNRTFGAVAQAFELVYHCRCGKQMFGEQLVKEYERQKTEFEAQGHVAEPLVDSGPLAMLAQAESRPRVPTLRPIASPPSEDPVAQAKRREDEDRRWREKVQVAAHEVSVATATPVRTPSTGVDPVCAWPGCGKPSRPNSKYCSRACSNKNARARHKARQKKAKKTKAVSI